MPRSIIRKRKKIYHRANTALIAGGEPFFTRLHQLIKNAKNCIHIQVYIFGDDETGHSIANALIEASTRGVQVYLLVDGYASSLPKEFIQQLTNAGIHFRFFEPVFRSRHFYFGRRLHHKVIVIDESIALVGGLNLADRYNDMPNEKAWMDMALQVDGGAALELQQVCNELWKKKIYIPFTRKKNGQQITEAGAKEDDCLVRIRRNDWVMGKEQIWKSYAELFRKSSKNITIMCAYFLPGSTYKQILKNAVRRGVEVTVILAGQSDIKIAKNAERYLYRWMLRNGIKIYEYQPTVLHAKVAVADDSWLTVGSYNINDISAYASIELNLEVKNKPLAEELATELMRIITEDSVHISPEKQLSIFSFTHIKQMLSYYTIRVMLKLSTFYFRQHE